MQFITPTEPSRRCPDCGAAVAFGERAEATCECGKLITRITQGETLQGGGSQIFLLPCPKCGDQKKARAEWIGQTEVCPCGQEFSFTLVLATVPPLPTGFIANVLRYAHQSWGVTMNWCRLHAVPWIRQALRYVREHVLPRISYLSLSAFTWVREVVLSILTPPPSSAERIRNEPSDVPRVDTNITHRMANPRRQASDRLPPIVEQYSRQQTRPDAETSKEQMEIHVPRCPSCGSTQCERISLGNKVGSAVLFGLFSLGHVSKTHRCKNCGAKW